MTTDKIPLPLQAVSIVLLPALFGGGARLLWAVASFWEENPSVTRVAGALVVLTLVIGVFAQYRYVRRSIVTGLVEASASPLALTVCTALGTAAAAVLVAYLPPGAPIARTFNNRNAIGFNAFLALATIWIFACAGILLSRPKAPE